MGALLIRMPSLLQMCGPLLYSPCRTSPRSEGLEALTLISCCSRSLRWPSMASLASRTTGSSFSRVRSGKGFSTPEKVTWSLSRHKTRGGSTEVPDTAHTFPTIPMNSLLWGLSQQQACGSGMWCFLRGHKASGAQVSAPTAWPSRTAAVAVTQQGSMKAPIQAKNEGHVVHPERREAV